MWNRWKQDWFSAANWLLFCFPWSWNFTKPRRFISFEKSPKNRFSIDMKRSKDGVEKNAENVRKWRWKKKSKWRHSTTLNLDYVRSLNAWHSTSHHEFGNVSRQLLETRERWGCNYNMFMSFSWRWLIDILEFF